jgi:hypothetical protein
VSDLAEIWNADHVRLTLFGPGVWNVDHAAFITQFVGVEVDATSTRPQMAETTTSAMLDGARRVEVKQQVNRLDFSIHPRLDQITTDGPPLLANAAQEMRLLTSWVEAWIGANNPQVVRIAIGGIALLPGIDKNWTYSKLKQLLPMVLLDPARHRDFQLRLNTPVPAKNLPGLDINALGTWAAMLMNVGLLSATGAVPLATITGQQKHFVHCGLDVNTDANRINPIPSQNLAAVLREALEVASELLKGAK